MRRIPLETLRATGILAQARRAGDCAPAITLNGLQGESIALADAWRHGPVIVVFFRGDWCGICMRQLEAWQAHAAALDRMGARLLAISPEAADRVRSAASGHGLSYGVISDPELRAATGFGVTLTFPPELVDLYAHLGTDPAILDADGHWVLPVPATFLVAPDGRVRFARVDLDDHKRTAPAEVLPVLRELGPGYSSKRIAPSAT